MFKMNLAGHSECAELLLEHGALVDELDVKVSVFFSSERWFISHEFFCINPPVQTHGESNNRLLSYRYGRKLSGI